eukprot:4106473-Lingulodinium_polyedra.AAC.1
MARSFAQCVAAQMRVDAKPFTPRARQLSARAWCDQFRVATHLRGDALREQTRHCVEQNLLYTVLRSFAQCVAAAARIPHATHAPCEHHFL